MWWMLMLVAQQPTVFTMSAQANWASPIGPPPLDVRLVATITSVSMTARVPLDVVITPLDQPIAISPFIGVTRGIGFDVETLDGKEVVAREPVIGSPPPPPLKPDAFTGASRDRPLIVPTREEARALFPGPGTYRVRAIVAVADYEATPVVHARAVSAPVLVRVTE